MKRTLRLDWPTLRTVARGRLERDLELLTIYCQDPDGIARQMAVKVCDMPELFKRYTFWPSRGLLQSLEENVELLIKPERDKPPSPAWKAFQLLDKRIPSLRLILRVNNLVKRAKERLKNTGESVLSKAARDTDSVEAQNLLRDLVLQKQNLGELLKDHDKRYRARLESRGLMLWLCKIGHPDAKDLLALGHVPASMARIHDSISQERKMMRQREKARDRDRRYRLRKKTSPKKRRPTTR